MSKTANRTFSVLFYIDADIAPLVIGALLVDYILEKGGINALKQALNYGSRNEDLYNFFKSKFNIDKIELSSILKKRLNKLATKDKMVFFIDL